MDKIGGAIMLTHVGTQTIETSRLILRPFAYTDSASMLKNWVADERVQFMYAEPVYTTEEAVKGLLDKYTASHFIVKKVLLRPVADIYNMNFYQMGDAERRCHHAETTKTKCRRYHRHHQSGLGMCRG